MTRQIFAAIAFFVLTAQASFATQYNVTVSGALFKYSPTLFGEAGPVNMVLTFTLDSANAVLLPANSPIDAAGNSFTTDVYRVQKAAVANLSATVGINGVFTSTDLQNAPLGTVGNYDILILGNLNAPTAISLALANSNGDVYFGLLSCDALKICSIGAYGGANSIADNGLGDFTSLFVSSSGTATPTEKVTELANSLGGIPISNKGLSKVLNFDLQTTKRLVTDAEFASSKKSLNLFITHVRAAQNGGSLSAADGDALVAKAITLRDSL